MGLLTPVANMWKTYGIFGASTPSAPVMPGYLSNYTDMADVRAKYLMVSVWANDNNAPVAPNLATFTIEFSSGAWGTYHQDVWLQPTTPNGVTDPRIPNTLGAYTLQGTTLLSVVFGFIAICT